MCPHNRWTKCAPNHEKREPICNQLMGESHYAPSTPYCEAAGWLKWACTGPTGGRETINARMGENKTGSELGGGGNPAWGAMKRERDVDDGLPVGRKRESFRRWLLRCRTSSCPFRLDSEGKANQFNSIVSTVKLCPPMSFRA